MKFHQQGNESSDCMKTGVFFITWVTIGFSSKDFIHCNFKKKRMFVIADSYWSFILCSMDISVTNTQVHIMFVSFRTHTCLLKVPHNYVKFSSLSPSQCPLNGGKNWLGHKPNIRVYKQNVFSTHWTSLLFHISDIIKSFQDRAYDCLMLWIWRSS
jgi:hypothetical protein